MKKRHVSAPDGGWGWLVVAASFIMQILTNGVTYSFGVMYIELLAYFQSSRSDAAWIGSIQAWLLYFTGIFAAPLIKRFGWRPVAIAGSVISAVGLASSSFADNLHILHISYGVVAGVGMGLMYATSMAVVQHYFDAKRPLANGLVVSGSGFGTLIFGSLLQCLIDTFGWRWALAIEGCIMLVGVVCAAFYRPLAQSNQRKIIADTQIPPENENKPDQSEITHERNTSPQENHSNDISNQSDSTRSKCCMNLWAFWETNIQELFDVSYVKNPVFLFITLATFAYTFGNHVQYTYTPDRAVALGIDRKLASFMVSVMGIANVISRPAIGLIGNRSAHLRATMAAAVLLIGGVVASLVLVYNTYVWLIIYSAMFGALSGGYISLLPVVVVDYFGVENFENSYGLHCTIISFGTLTASPLSGFIVDKTDDVNAAFYLVGGLEVVGGIAFLIANIIHRKRSKTLDYESLK